MVAYSFQKCFVEPIERGEKCQTIRAVGKRKHAKPGDFLQLYFAMRTQHCRKIIEDVRCDRVDEVVITFERGEITDIAVSGERVEDIDAFARRDGFSDVDDMATYWQQQHGTENYTGNSYPLVLITWRPNHMAKKPAKKTPRKSAPKRETVDDTLEEIGQQPDKSQLPLWEGASVPEIDEAAKALYKAQTNRLRWASKEKECREQLEALFDANEIPANTTYRTLDDIDAGVKLDKPKAYARKAPDED